MMLLPPPSDFVVAHAWMVPEGGAVLDLACGSGRHLRFFRDRGHPVVGIDRRLDDLRDLTGDADVETIQADLEDGGHFPLEGRRFAGVVVTNYLYRPLLPAIVRAVAPGGALIYETFALGNERFGRPSNPDFLLKPGELIEAMSPDLRIVTYEDRILSAPRPAAVQRIAARRERGEGA